MNNKMKMPIENGLFGVTQALRDGTSATDILVAAGDRKTNEFKIAFWPKDIDRAIHTAERIVADLKLMRLRGTTKSVIMN